MSSWRCALLLTCCSAVPSKPLWFRQRVSHFSASDATYLQRYYQNDSHFGGPGSPIFVIMGGEGGISPETGIFYPWVTDVLARHYKALVIQPEHRFYGESLPFGNRSYDLEHLTAAMSSQEALADAAELIGAVQRQRSCGGHGEEDYCPVLVLGGSYPGFLAAMMRMRYPAVVDMAYASSAPLRFYSQEVDQYAYYEKVTESAERSVPGCAAAVKQAFTEMADLLSANLSAAAQSYALCEPLRSSRHLSDDLLFLAEQTFANLNMANYPPQSDTGLRRACGRFVAAQSAPERRGAVRELLLTETTRRHEGGRAHLAFRPLERGSCFDVSEHLPAGPAATARCGDWSGCGSGRDGQMWDFQTCSFEVEKIGFGGRQMFPSFPWSSSWLENHCQRRFQVRPQPLSLSRLWGFDSLQSASRIVFVNGLNDGWSVGSVLHDVAPQRGLLALNLPNGAHHSELSHEALADTPDVLEVHEKLLALFGRWLGEVKAEEAASRFARLLV